MHLPSHQVATLMTRVTQTMFGFGFRVIDGPQALTREKAALLVATGQRPVAVLLTTDAAGSRALGARVFACTPEQLDPAMIDDSLRELANMAAGQIVRALKVDAPLGLPHILDAEGLSRPDSGWQRHRLRAEPLDLEVWISSDPADWSLSAAGAK